MFADKNFSLSRELLNRVRLNMAHYTASIEMCHLF